MRVQYIPEEFEDSEERGYNGPGWYFWDETLVYCYGPYSSKEIAEQNCDSYYSSL